MCPVLQSLCLLKSLPALFSPLSSPHPFCPHQDLFPLLYPSASSPPPLHLFPFSARPRSGSGCVTFSRPFSTETSRVVRKAGTEGRPTLLPVQPALRPLLPPPPTFLTSSFEGWRGIWLQGLATLEGGLAGVTHTTPKFSIHYSPVPCQHYRCHLRL